MTLGKKDQIWTKNWLGSRDDSTQKRTVVIFLGASGGCKISPLQSEDFKNKLFDITFDTLGSSTLIQD